MSLQGLSRGGTVTGSIVIREARPGGKVSCFDGREPRGTDGEAGRGMKVNDEGFHAGEIVGAESG